MFKYYYVDENNLNVVDKIRYSAFAIWLSIVKFLFFSLCLHLLFCYF